ncbi:mitochondrial chaperone BCS1-B-like protein [Emericellopsis cladophorae]|uniref:Mitochondrial chaperone BCS1-B-like protein n=1 Tax=Emericellopsis cladophorae TaxID=2686198 RepID=A0A9P9Y5S9_9HYPO|nr:mitochondrial chaperone BCS1-B-like protein [Emericellopsis cladophorae]KAI6783555.1 mitochondrial chaperone BCS1-B-like protein [Emericellopsis cladophorae]
MEVNDAPSQGSPNTTSQQQFAVLDMFIPGFSLVSSLAQAYLGIDLNLYIPMLMVLVSTSFAWSYISSMLYGLIESHLMSSVRIRTDDEIFNMIMAWVATQNFSRKSRRFIANTNLNSRAWSMWRFFNDEDEDEDEDEEQDWRKKETSKNKKQLRYTPSYGTHLFFFRHRPLLFERCENREQMGSLMISEKEEIIISCFGRSADLIKELLHEAREQHMAKDEQKTLIYRGGSDGQGGDLTWKRCMARSTRPFSTVILNEKVKQELVDDVADYLAPKTRKWYANRGIPYRRGYLLHGPPGTGKSSLSLALAGYFRMKIYILSLSSPMATEDNVSQLFASLPMRCVVLLEDIDSAGLTHTREGESRSKDDAASPPAPAAENKAVPHTGRLSLSGLLNILDGVASQEGRVLIMTTNHIEKLDKALIRPGRVDMTVEFGRADPGMTASIFRAMYTPFEGEETPSTSGPNSPAPSPAKKGTKALKDTALAEKQKLRDDEARNRATERIVDLSHQFAAKIPSGEFSPAEIQGLLLRHKRSPLAAIDAVDSWITSTRKDKMEREAREAEEKEKARKKAEREKRRKAKQKAKKKAKGEDVSSSGSGSDLEIEAQEQAGGKDTRSKATPDSGYGTS